jgi:glycosyltransferase involved in cell wall biosynthesis
MGMARTGLDQHQARPQLAGARSSVSPRASRPLSWNQIFSLTGRRPLSAPDKKSVLFVSVNTFYGGGEAHVVNLARLLSGHCNLYALVFDQTFAQKLRNQGVEVRQLALFPSSARALQVLHALFVLPLIVLRERIAVVQVTGTVETLLLPVARVLGCNTVSVRHLIPFLGHGTRLSRLRRLAIEVTYAIGTLFAKSVVCVSETIGFALRKTTYNRELRVIRNWVPSVPPRRSRYKHESRVRLLFVGRLEPHKGAQLLLHALKNLHDQDYELTIVGDGSDMARLQSLAVGLNVHFAGFQHDLSRYYENADVFVMPSLGPEGLPLVTIEAMSYGLPCVLSDLPVHEEVSREGEAAILFKSGDSESLSMQLQHLLGARARAGTMETWL